jgi:hypothetical protein
LFEAYVPRGCVLSFEQHAEVTLTHVPHWGTSGKHLLTVRFTPFDPKQPLLEFALRFPQISLLRASEKVRLSLQKICDTNGDFVLLL